MNKHSFRVDETVIAFEFGGEQTCGEFFLIFCLV